ncbi:MAG: hypothetical protein AB7L41_04585 [Flavobacteriaceae bacterium]
MAVPIRVMVSGEGRALRLARKPAMDGARWPVVGPLLVAALVGWCSYGVFF